MKYTKKKTFFGINALSRTVYFILKYFALIINRIALFFIYIIKCF